MTPTDEHSTARALLDRYADEAARLGTPVWIEWRTASTAPGEAAGEAPGGAPGDALETRRVSGREGLLGRTVSVDWDGAAVVGTGRFRLLDEAHEPPAALKPGFSGGLTMACSVCRDGRIGWRMRLPDGSFYDRVPEEGFMLDILRRSLGLATPPAPTSIAPLELAAWFAAIIARSMEDERRLDWGESLFLHPAVANTPGVDEEDAESRLRSHPVADEWDVMRRVVAAGLATATTPPPELAEWMDAGMFARWVLDGLPPLPALLSMVQPHLQPAALRRMRHLARGLDDRVATR